MLDFDVVLEKDKETGQIYASVPTLPGCYSYGDTVEEALKNIKEAIELHKI
jgi:predicted RNase H-like HicB family nuclease